MSDSTLTAPERRAAALRLAAQARRQAAVARAETAIRQLIKDKKQINFRSVARTAGVSLDFLYANTGLRQRIEKLRAQEMAAASLPAPRPARPWLIRAVFNEHRPQPGHRQSASAAARRASTAATTVT